jgi:uncharacterized membrane protein YdjX (TVP38/TMEM64 family)
VQGYSQDVLGSRAAGRLKAINQHKRNHAWIKLLLLVVLLVGFTWLLYGTGVVQFFINKRRLVDFLDSLGPWGFAGFIAVQAAQVVAAPIPGEVTGLLGGYLYGPVLGIGLSTIGLTCGSLMAFGLARTFGRPFVERFVAEATMNRFDYLLHHKGAFLVFLLFLVPGFPKDYLCYILGLGHLSYLEFVVIGGTGRLFGTILLTMGGNFIRLHQYGRFSVLVGIAVIVIFLAMAYRDKMEKLFRALHIRGQKSGKSETLTS